jgi:hypothetical protein
MSKKQVLCRIESIAPDSNLRFPAAVAGARNHTLITDQQTGSGNSRIRFPMRRMTRKP